MSHLERLEPDFISYSHQIFRRTILRSAGTLEQGQELNYGITDYSMVAGEVNVEGGVKKCSRTNRSLVFVPSLTVGACS